VTGLSDYGSAGLDGMAAMGVQTNFRNFRTYELYRNNGALSVNPQPTPSCTEGTSV